jgi:hypothetical protein
VEYKVVRRNLVREANVHGVRVTDV